VTVPVEPPLWRTTQVASFVAVVAVAMFFSLDLTY
jgi:hypothetical protein